MLLNTNLSRSNIVFDWVNAQAEDVIIVTQIQPLSVLLPIIYNSYRSNMIHHFSSLCVEQVISTVIASVTEVNTKQITLCFKTVPVIYKTNHAINLCINLEGVQLRCQLQLKLPQHTGRERLFPPRAGLHQSPPGLLCT